MNAYCDFAPQQRNYSWRARLEKKPPMLFFKRGTKAKSTYQTLL